MATDPYAAKLREAEGEIQANRPVVALEQVDRVLESAPNRADFVHIRAVALAQLDRDAEATQAFERAVALASFESKYFFNFAVHLAACGDNRRARTVVRQALEIRPDYPEATILAARLEGLPNSIEPSSGSLTGVVAHRPGYENPDPHLFGFGVGWTRVGYALLGVSVVVLLLWQFHNPLVAVKATTAKSAPFALRTDVLSQITVFLYVTTLIANVSWTIFDVIDRRKRFVWVLPMLVCSCTWALGAIPLALYLFYGRKRA
jgi:tetratricopeptide (TPR) repeat protein